MKPEEFSALMCSLRNAYGATANCHTEQLKIIYDLLSELGYEEGMEYFVEVV